MPCFQTTVSQGKAKGAAMLGCRVKIGDEQPDPRLPALAARVPSNGGPDLCSAAGQLPDSDPPCTYLGSSSQDDRRGQTGDRPCLPSCLVSRLVSPASCLCFCLVCLACISVLTRVCLSVFMYFCLSVCLSVSVCFFCLAL